MNYPNRVIKEGEVDAVIVKAIQQKLIDHGIGNLQGTGFFGAKTKSAIKLFQATHSDNNGFPLEIDGKVGSITWQTLFGENTIPVNNETSGELLTEVVKVAVSQLGVMEVPPGSNRGAEVDAYLASTNTPPGNYWCAAFVFWCFNEAAKNLGRENPLVKTAGCIDHWNKTSGKKIIAADVVNNPSILKSGDIFIIDFGSGNGHTGIVENIDGGFIHTIEGNSNNDGSRNGIGVFRVVRKIVKITKGFIEYQ